MLQAEQDHWNVISGCHINDDVGNISLTHLHLRRFDGSHGLVSSEVFGSLMNILVSVLFDLNSDLLISMGCTVSGLILNLMVANLQTNILP
jgi:hypothetical protein